MNELRLFDYNGMQVRTIEKDGQPWWVLKDVCEVLELSNPTMIAERLDEDERAKLDLGRQGKANCVNESGLYNVILRSDKPEAKPFRKWVTAEVLPSIRKTGSYTVNKSDKVLAIKEMNARVRLSNQYLKLANVDTLSKEYKNILVSKASEALSGERLIPLPSIEQKGYTATDIGNMFGVSAQMVGRISNRYHLKTDENGSWCRSKSEHSPREVDMFVYNDNTVEEFRRVFTGQ